MNTQLYSAKEKAELKNLVNIHIAYNITYQQQRNMEGQVRITINQKEVAFIDVENTKNLQKWVALRTEYFETKSKTIHNFFSCLSFMLTAYNLVLVRDAL